MALDLSRLEEALDRFARTDPLSGAVAIHQDGEVRFARAYGTANRSDSLPNRIDTRFQVASGCKIFTSVAVCQLAQRGHFDFSTPVRECLDIDFPHLDPRVTVHHLLTHTSGIPDYFDEEGGEDFEEIWREKPTYSMRAPSDFLPLFQRESMLFDPGERFCYSGSGFILLGLLVEQHSRCGFPEYVTENVFGPCGMEESGYFHLDRLPVRTASAYIENEDGSWRSNIYSVPVVGGPDGGAFVTVGDMVRFWEALHAHRVLDQPTTEILLKRHIKTGTDSPPTYYGYGVWITDTPPIHYVEGWDPGVAFLSAYYPNQELTVTIARNVNRSVWRIFDEIAPILEGA